MGSSHGCGGVARLCPVGSDDGRPETYVPPRLIPYNLRSSLRRVTLSWAFGSLWMYITTGAALTRYAKLLHMPEYGFGLLAAVPFVSALAQLPASYVMEHYGGRKRLFLAAGLFHRSMWVLVAAIPWFVPDAWWWLSLLGLLAISSLAGHVATPGVYGWFADLVPRQVRGRYFSRRMQVGQLVGLVVTTVVGLVLDQAGAIGDAALRRTISVGLVSAALCGVLDFVILSTVSDPPGRAPDPSVHFWGMLGGPLRNRNFRRYLAYNATLTFGLGYVGQYVWLYAFDVVKLNNTVANLTLVGAPLIVALICTPFWGRLIDRMGRRPILIIAGVLIAPGAAVWILVTKDNLWWSYILILISVFAWPGVDLANFNLLLGLTASHSADHHGSAYVAANSIVVAIAGALSGVFGAAIAGAMKDWHGQFLWWPLTYHGLLFLISGGLRLGALLFVLPLEDRGAYATRRAIRDAVASLHSNLHHSLVVPVRRAAALRRTAYKLREDDGED